MSSRWIHLPLSEGVAPRQAHADLPTGSYEREIGREGFFGPATHMLHAHPPTAWSGFDGPLRPRAFDLGHLQPGQSSPWQAHPLLGNDDTQLRYWRPRGPSDHLVRNGDGDELLFVHTGGGALYTDYGRLQIAEGDYVVLPRGTMWRLDAEDPTDVLMVEATGAAYKLPDKGIVGEHAIFDPALLRTPKLDEAFVAQQDNTPWRVVVKRRGKLTTITYPFNPLDAIGWQGSLVPVAINWRAIRPLMSHRYHLPPSAHSTFVSDRFVVCTFCPRPIESDPGALKVPFFHANDDFDEVLFYHRGQFFSRDNIHAGMLTFHPSGFTHGPHPKALAIGQQGSRRDTDEVAVMLDTRNGLSVHTDAEAVEWTDYAASWGTMDAQAIDQGRSRRGPHESA